MSVHVCIILFGGCVVVTRCIILTEAVIHRAWFGRQSEFVDLYDGSESTFTL